MKMQFQLNDRMTVELEGDTHIAIAEQLAELEEVFGDMTCRKNGKTSDKVVWRVREDSDENKYYEMVCVDPDDADLRYCKKSFGQTKKGGKLFPRPLKGDDDKTIYDGGLPVLWKKWNPETKKEE